MKLGKSFSTRVRELFSLLPLPFFGLALWRAWVNVSFAAPSGVTPLSLAASHRLFDIAMLVAFALMIAGARRFSPLNGRRWALRLCPGLMTLYSLVSAASMLWPSLGTLAPVFTALAAAGSTLMVLLWSELYAGLTPLKVLLGLTGSYALASVLVFLLNGFYPAYYAGAVAMLPFASIACLRRASRSVTLAHLRSCGRGTIPWRVVFVMALYGFAYGLSGVRMSDLSGVNSSFTTFCVAGLLFLALAGLSDRLSFGAVQKLPPAFMVASLVLVSLSSLMGQVFLGVGLTAAMLLSYFFVDATLCDVARRFGISAVWLFSIEETASMSAELLGGFVGDAVAVSPVGQIPAFPVVLGAVLVAASLVAAVLLLSPKGLSQHWGVKFAEQGALAVQDERQKRQQAWVRLMAAQHRLSPREEEVLELLVSNESMRAIARKLTISEGTAKSHASHIYEKLDLSGKKELQALAQAALR